MKSPLASFVTGLAGLSRKGMPYMLAAVLAAVVGAGLTQTASPPLVNLSQDPLYSAGARVKPTLTLALSVEFPTVGATYKATSYVPSTEYVGYFDQDGCYDYVVSSQRFERTANATKHVCSNKFSGNFMNWASSSAIDILRYGLTGGDRIVDTENETVLQRAVLMEYNTTSFYNSGSYFPHKLLAAADAAGAVPSDLRYDRSGKSPTAHNGDIHIANCLNRVYFGTAKEGSCSAPGKDGNLWLPAMSDGRFLVRNKVCDTIDEVNLRRDLCLPYPNGKFKPGGELQKKSDLLKIAVFGYLQDDARTRYGGVLRAPMKFVGPTTYDVNNNEIPGLNPNREWDPQTGVFINNPGPAPAGAAYGYSLSGAINYLNRFGRLGAEGRYKALDPLSELYYEALRYIQGQQPTSQAISGIDNAMRDAYPVYTQWDDPLPQAADAGDYACQRNNIITIADKNTHSDLSLPGNQMLGTQSADFKRSVLADEPDAVAWTRVVDGYERNTSVSYATPKGVAATTSNPNGATPSLDAQNRGGTTGNLATQYTGSNDGSYYIAGLAYWANTQEIRAYPGDAAKRRTGSRVRTYVIDVNEANGSDNATTRHAIQLYLAAKYGGFIDENNDGNPYKGTTTKPDNSRWQGSDGEAANYFKVDNAQRLLASLREIFDRVTRETGSIAGGAVASQTVSSSESNAVYQAQFDPRSWTGSVAKFPLGLDTDGNVTVSKNPAWRTGVQLDRRAAERNIVVGRLSKSAVSGTANKFLWDQIEADHQAALGKTPAGTDDGRGQDRLKFLRGDRSQEGVVPASGATFRTRTSIAGDIVNSGVVFVGAPARSIAGATYVQFYTDNKSRTRALYAGANDGMLHAFRESDGEELFAYIPSFLVSKLTRLTAAPYVHTAFVDATPVVAEAQVGSSWKTVLVSGAGAGSQGVFALDVTNPNNFLPSSVLWEFTDRNDGTGDADLGNVVGQPRIVKIRTSAADASTPQYKWFAVIASGVNNYAADGSASASGNPVIFLLDLSKPGADAWAEGTNYYKIRFPQSDSLAKGLVSFTTIGGADGALRSLYAGDLQGNLWKLDFASAGSASTTNWTLDKLSAYPGGGSIAKPMFVARTTASTTSPVQPITAPPAIFNGPNGTSIVVLATGKYLEPSDNSARPVNSMYGLLDNGISITDRSSLSTGTADAATGAVTVPAFFWGNPPSPTRNTKAGWVTDFPQATSGGERQISGIQALGGNIYFGSIIPGTAGCAGGQGRVYSINTLSGAGSTYVSSVGIQATPIVVEVASTSTISDSKDRRVRTSTRNIITLGATGSEALKGSGGQTVSQSVSLPHGQLTWRQIFNYEERKNAP